ncbi:hypothetical protein BDR26DRAFT_849886 [Obelidium mucronatum]|nr:hypothetical protein BDR26DRAFT_849886 [Obelidium mucronatum]
MKDLSGVAKEITAISVGGGPTNWAILAEDSATKSIQIIEKGGNGLPELRKAIQKTKSSAAISGAAMVGFMFHNNMPLKIRLMDTKSSIALAKHHDVKVLLKHHVAVVDVKDVEKDLMEAAVENAVSNLTPVPSPVGQSPVDELELEVELNRAFEEQLKVVETLKRGAAEKLNRFSQGIAQEQKEALALQLKSREKTDEWKKVLLAKTGGPMFEGWLAFRPSATSAWKAKWAVVDSKRLDLYRDETKSTKPTVISLVASRLTVCHDDGAIPNSFQLNTAPVPGAMFYTESRDLLFRINAIVELSA